MADALPKTGGRRRGARARRRRGWAGLVAAGLVAAGLFAAGLAASPMTAAAQTPGDPLRGEEAYRERCALCHALDANGAGPAHRGVYGRKAAGAPGYGYSRALERLDLVWTEETLDAWLRDPTGLAPGTMMAVAVPERQARADIIAYLKSVSPGAE